MKVISSYVSVASQLEVKLQTDIIASLLSYYIAVSSNFTSCINLLDNLLTFWIPELEKFYGDRNKQLSDNVKRDYLFYKDTVYTHTGDIEKSYECEELCDKLIDNMSLKGLRHSGSNCVVLLSNATIINSSNSKVCIALF